MAGSSAPHELEPACGYGRPKGRNAGKAPPTEVDGREQAACEI